ncbi:Torsin-2A [Chionoecetes opilio]|uniref:Torsin-2A n=1 Tax=Chionoecetes opilio TaxID=41210 RepID=A0A8J4YUC9_CHIOP|nr:Torsin-2A [Chionoecetes opilio]
MKYEVPQKIISPVRARLSLKTYDEVEDCDEVEGEDRTRQRRPKSATPYRPMASQRRSQQSSPQRSSSESPWPTYPVIHGAPRHSRPGRSLTKGSSKKQRDVPPAASGGNRHFMAFLVGILAFASSCLLAAYFSFLLPNQESSCLAKRNAELPLTELKRQLKKNLVGQNIAVDSLVHNLEAFVASRAERPLVLWLSGWEGSGKTLTINTIRTVLPKDCKVQTVLAQLLPDGADSLHEKALTLVQGLDPCTTNLLVIDGWDGEPHLPLAILDQFLKSLRHPEALARDPGRVLVVLSGTRGSREIWQHFLDLQRTHGADRNYLEYDFTDLSARLRETHFLIPVSVEVALVPFLPMEVTHLRSCVVRELLKGQREDVLIEEEALARVTKEVLAHTEFVPGSEPPIAIHGCKRVSSILALVLSGSLDDLLRL